MKKKSRKAKKYQKSDVYKKCSVSFNVVFNAPFKSKINAFATQHLQEHLNKYLHGKFTAGEQRVHFTKWIGEVWAEMTSKQEMIQRAFRKCGISVAVDGSEDDEIHIEGLEDYTVDTDDEHTDTGDDPFSDGDEDPFADIDETQSDHSVNED